MDWRRVGNAAIDRSQSDRSQGDRSQGDLSQGDTTLAGLATGPVERVWFSGDGARLSIRTATGSQFVTTDSDTWTATAPVEPPPAPASPVSRLPERAAVARIAPGQPSRVYAFGRFVYRSDDGGAVWENVTAFQASSIVGDGLRDLAVSPVNPDDVVVAGAAGVFRSLDGGKSWSGLNQGLPNLPVARIRALPSGSGGAQVELSDASVVEWQPGEKTAWRPHDSTDAQTDLRLRQALTLERGAEVTAVAISGNFVYTGMASGSIVASSDSGRTWQASGGQSAPVRGFWIDPQDPRVAVAVLGTRTSASGPEEATVHVVRTQNGGSFWDNITANLPDASVNGVAADRASGAIYVATDRGVFFTRTDLGGLGAAMPWTPLAGLPQTTPSGAGAGASLAAAPKAMDVRLDEGGNQLWVALAGYGTYAALAPHRVGDPRVVSAADLVARSVAPGSLLSVAGAKVDTARAGDLNVPVLASSDTESQLQVPFEASGTTLSLAIDSSGGRRVFEPMALGAAAPAIFVNRDGAPLLLDGDSGVMLDAMHPAHSRTRIQVLSTGLGAVTPDWPTGMPAPLENSPRVVTPVKAWLDRAPVDVTRAVLAPGYVGLYLVEVEIPSIVNYGPAELYIEAAGQSSTRVRVYIEP
jgi:uncharacterized protein (TIGR03437 family)